MDENWPLYRDTQPEPCTGIAAVWCPNCGQCSCPEAIDGSGVFFPHNRATMRKSKCPLHKFKSGHRQYGDDEDRYDYADNPTGGPWTHTLPWSDPNSDPIGDINRMFQEWRDELYVRHPT